MEINRIDDLRKVLGKLDGGKILDIACGAGQFIEILIDSLNSWEHITGLDISDEIMQEAKKKFSGKGFAFEVGNAMELPCRSDSFDMVCISKGLHHVSNPVEALMEMLRVVRKEGLVLIYEMYSDDLNDSQETQKMYHHLRVEVDQLLGIDHNYTFTKSELLELIENIPLKDLQLFEFLEPSMDPNDPDMITEYINKMKGWIDQLKDHPESDRIKMKMISVRDKMLRHGMSRPPVYLITGRKPG